MVRHVTAGPDGSRESRTAAVRSVSPVVARHRIRRGALGARIGPVTHRVPAPLHHPRRRRPAQLMR
ncbi:hypothetical protein [Streptomyces sp. RP5T]|uniref:hypothetical protein n=1 Tax=Streptomyces sp. RP5T TaxID=2490848 RepID=UPI0021AD641B|nr:hypothetical protein [Streptomyces sp. RP5T]